MERSTIAIMLVLANAAIAIWIVVAWPEQFCLDPLPGQSSAPCIGTSVGEFIRAPIVVAAIVNAILISMLIKSPRR